MRVDFVLPEAKYKTIMWTLRAFLSLGRFLAGN